MICSAAIVLLQTVLFYYVLFCHYNYLLAAPLDSGGYLMVVLYAAIIVLIFKTMGALRVGHNKKSNIIISHVISILFTDFMTYIQLSLIHRAFMNPVPFIIILVVQIVISFVWTIVASGIHEKYIPKKNLILVYADKTADKFVYKMLEREDMYCIRESVRYKKATYNDNDNIEEVKQRIKDYESILICGLESSARNDLLKYCYENNKEVYLPPRISDIIIRCAQPIEQFDTPLVLCKGASLTATQLIIKRVIDIIVSIFGIIVLSPVLAIIALAIKLYDGGPVLYKQKRVTIDEKIFEIYKFRSMVVDAEKNGVIPAEDNDPRITPVGKIIRAVRFDELPQLFNILKGEMSVVGPRPERIEHHELYTSQIPEFPYRTKVKAGLTGYAQVMGKYNTVPYDKLLLDIEYIQNFSFFLDFKIILLTVKVIFMKESTEGFKNNKKSKGDKHEKDN